MTRDNIRPFRPRTVRTPADPDAPISLRPGVNLYAPRPAPGIVARILNRLRDWWASPPAPTTPERQRQEDTE